MPSKKVLASVVVAASATLFASFAQAQSTTIRFSYWVPPQAMPGPVLEAWVKRINDDAKGALTVQSFPASQLGKATDHYDMARDGIADIAWAVPGFQAGRFTMFSATELPFMASMSPEGVAAFDDWYRAYAVKEMADVKYCMTMAAPVSVLNFTSKRVEAPSDIKGIRVRPTNTTIGRYLSGLGASVVQVPASEAAQAFERGLLDGLVLSWGTMIPFGLEKSTKFHMEFPFALSTSAFVMNKKKYDSLNPQQKAVIDKHCSADAAQRVAKEWDDWDQQGRSVLEKQGGHTFYKISAQNQALWKAAADQLQKDWIKEAAEKGYDAQKAFADLRAQIAKRKAGF